MIYIGNFVLVVAVNGEPKPDPKAQMALIFPGEEGFDLFLSFYCCDRSTTDHCILLQLTLGRLGKLHGKAQPHSEEVEWWRTFMVECVRIFKLYQLQSVKKPYTLNHESFPQFNFFIMWLCFSMQLT